MYLSVLEDLTRRLTAKDADRGDDLEKVFDAVSDMIIIFDPKGRIVRVNQAGLAILKDRVYYGRGVDVLVQGAQEEIKRAVSQSGNYGPRPFRINGSVLSLKLLRGDNGKKIVVISPCLHDGSYEYNKD